MTTTKLYEDLSRTVSANVSVYRGQSVALLTQHGKEAPLREVLGAGLGCRIQHVSDYDTDQFGTFTRDIARIGSQLDAARAKARMGMQLSRLSIGLASEGAFGPDPVSFMLPHNLELLLWIDDGLGIEVIATASGHTNFSHKTVPDFKEAKHFAESAGFPEHHLIVRPDDEHHPQFRKDLSTWDAFQEAVDWALSLSLTGKVFIETDMRAFANPTRMLNIRRAAAALVEKLSSLCPACGAPGFAKSGVVRGLPCEDCGQATEQAKADIIACVRCTQQILIDREEQFAAAGNCDYCNP
ncbi:hypothetical protein JWZ98_02880 [Methylomonas sp. EFPC1]|uniref:DUF6671 family protein n=1 Tax=Methylomonas defluvii TaxID=3045149 RepID=A0ABU4UAR7_9GAMM|nr:MULTISPECIES: DUF6671 family protein [unclassified Methylomonas]MDX8125980.1 DUF6671 family protein [Methylomonas sp. OY6]QSB01921.1 hypothetical protein JWZ98_02880 [Methylomonas sp. EFPC1]